MTEDEIVKAAVRAAQERARAEGLRIGQTVAHPDEPVACDLLSVEGDEATIRWKDVRRTFPLRELFDPNVANRIAAEMELRQIHGVLIAAAPLN